MKAGYLESTVANKISYRRLISLRGYQSCFVFALRYLLYQLLHRTIGYR